MNWFTLGSAVAWLLVQHAACANYEARPGHGFRTDETRTRITPKNFATLPDGAERGESLRIKFPGDATRAEALAFYLEVARKRGAHWVSRLRWLLPGPCIQTLMPDSVSSDHDVLFIKKEDYQGGATEHTFERETERIARPYVRTIDGELTSLDEEMKIWAANHDARCTQSGTQPLELLGMIHGREAIGVMKGPRMYDLTSCGASVQAPPVAGRLPLGDMSRVDEADRVLPKWIGSPIALTDAKGVTAGVLKRYSRQTMTIETAANETVTVHILDASKIELTGAVPTPEAPASPQPRSEECREWAP